MQAIPRKQARPVQQRRWIEPTQPQRHGKAPMYAQGHGMIPYFIPTCHFCGFDGHIRPRCFRYIKMCKTRSMIEKKKNRAMMHVPRNEKLICIILGHLEPMYQRPLGRKMFYLGGLERIKMFAMLHKLP